MTYDKRMRALATVACYLKGFGPSAIQELQRTIIETCGPVRNLQTMLYRAEREVTDNPTYDNVARN
jgi:hypothetical protein